MNLSLECGGETIEFECFDNKLSAMVATEILSGRTYPPIDAVTDVEIVLDVGANVGAAALYLSIMYPRAKVYAFEPASEPFALLQRNTRDRRNIVALNFGLFSAHRDVPLYRGAIDTVTASVGDSTMNRGDHEIVTLRAVSDWLEESSVDRVDVLKLDTEGCELPILRGMGDLVGSVKVLHVEYHSEDDRRTLDRLVSDTHLLTAGHIPHAHRGELTYVSKSVAATDPAFARYEIRVDI
jgi:FkbM family methyltransferase